MRKSLCVSLVGLLGLSSLAGCGLIQNVGNSCGDGCCAIAPKHASSRKKATGGSARDETSRPSKHVAIAQQSTRLPAVVESAKEAPPVSKRTERQSIKKDEMTVQEDEILRRELAALQGKSLTRVVDEMPRVEAVPIVRPAPRRAVKPMVATPGVSAKPAADPNEVISETDTPTAKSGIPAKEKTIALRSVDIHYGHTDGFKSVTGQVQLYRKTWRLRYADVGQEDTYGGAVVLEGNPDLSKLRDGCHVRVNGVLLPPTTRTGSAMYRVQTIEILD